MNNISIESKISFAGTMVFHLLLLLMAFSMSLSNKKKSVEFVELSFTAIELPDIKPPQPVDVIRQQSNIGGGMQQSSQQVQVRQSSPIAGQSAAARPNAAGTGVGVTQPVNTAPVVSNVPQIAPPRYTISMESDPQAVRVPGSKIDVGDSREQINFDRGVSTSSNQEKGNFSGVNGSGSSETLPGSGGSVAGSGGTGGSSVSSGIAVPGSSNVGKEIKGFSVAWNNGGNRGKTSGSMPRYPENSNKEVQIKVQITVAPDGSITQIIPLQKADHAFENSVETALKTWKFEKLRQGVAEEHQTGIITFNFKLE